MVDQSFSVRNFRRVFDDDLKKQGDIARDYFPDEFLIYKRIKSLLKKFRRYSKLHKKKKISSAHFENRKKQINNIIELRKGKFEDQITLRLHYISNTVNRKGFKLPLVQSTYTIGGKNVFSIGNNIETIFTSLNLIRTLKTVYSITPSNRNTITSRLKRILDDESNKVVVRVDVEQFYESIPHNRLLDLIHTDPSLSVIPKRIITQLVRDYSKITRSNRGLPRGVGISAYLSELFMRDVDTKAESMGDIVYYARYVDDLVFVFAPTEVLDAKVYLNSIQDLINNKGLTLNKKTEVLNVSSASGKYSFDYLGYQFTFQGLKLTVGLTKKKIIKYKQRIDMAFDDYARKSKYTPRKAERLLLLRIKFLSGNTRLLNSKRNAFIGTYASNQNLTSHCSFTSIVFRDRARYRLSYFWHVPRCNVVHAYTPIFKYSWI